MKPLEYEITTAASPEARQWEGWGTHLKPAIEQWWLVRKPLAEKSVAANILKWGTGALNIDASRIPVHQPKGNPKVAAGGWETSYKPKGNCHPTDPGTFAGRPKATTGWDYEYERGEDTIWKERFNPRTPFPEGATSPESIGKGYQGKTPARR